MALRKARDWKRPVVFEVGAANSFGQVMIQAEAGVQKTQPRITLSYVPGEQVARLRQLPSELVGEVELGMASRR